MVEIFLVQFLAAGLGAGSTAMADLFYETGRIHQRLHSVWVSTSIAVICSPVLVWAVGVFLGAGLLGQVVASIPVGTMFFWVYRNLQRLPPVEALSPRLPEQPSDGTVPPASRINS